MVRVSSASGGYDVHIGRGVRRQLPDLAGAAAPSGQCAVLSDDQVFAHWGARAVRLLEEGGLDVVSATFPEGEASKTRDTWAALTDALLEAGLGRDCAVVALGGGVTGDVAGFVAATYLRGVPFVQVPTTTLAMIDASVGAKTGVDHPAGKNLVGAFHAPRAVVADTEFLDTLAPERRAEGFAEAVKHGAVLDATYAEWLAGRANELLACAPAVVERAVVRSVELKAGVASADEFEAGRRQILNFGHTVGHALEAASGYALPHGRAVSAGMVAEARMGEALGVTAPGTAARIRSMVRAFGLPDEPDQGASPQALAALMTRDKKVRDGVVHVVLLQELGTVAANATAWAHPVPVRELVPLLANALRPGRLAPREAGRV